MAYPDPASNSAKLYERARAVMPGGNSRLTIFQSPYPIYAERGAGCRVYDVDGVERVDFVNNYTSLLHGHADPGIMAAVTAQLARGTCFSFPTELEIGLAELLCERVPALDTVRFTNSGSEAVMVAVKAARAYTNRAKIAKVEGAYHGSYDYVEVSLETPPPAGSEAPPRVAYSRGTPQGVLDDVVVIPFNDPAAASRILLEHARELAAIIFDPLPNRAGLIPASREFVDVLARIARDHGIVLICDEVITFRLGMHGAQHEFGLTPDLTTLGKVIGGGFPIGAVGGKRDVMAVFDPTLPKTAAPHGGTFNANPISMIAGLTAIEAMTSERFAAFNELGAYARKTLQRAMADSGVPAQVTGAGTLFRLHATDRALTDYQSSNPRPDEKRQM
ncbi:MAG TPA: aspartate aminotransferase family protein, partial [Casimicrobiaceae bacterium]|nr:aspartate aminotransferase family protein [Casimicrobiaceae bacterium]